MSDKARPILVPEDLSFDNIIVANGAIKTTDKYAENPIIPDNVDMKPELRIGYNQSKGKMIVHLNIMLIAMDENKNEIGLTGEFTLAFELVVKGLTEHLNEIRPMLIPMAAGVCYSTARGIILERTMSTYFRGVMIPVLSHANLLQCFVSGPPEKPAMKAPKSKAADQKQQRPH